MANYNQLLVKDPLQFMRTYSVHPMDNVGGYRGELVSVLNDVTDDHRSMKYTRVKSAKKVAYVNAFKKPQGNVQATGNEGADTVHFEPSYTESAGAVPIYFLPWDEGGAMVQLTIPPQGTWTPDPNLFFTAAINGCSVFIQGTADQPTIYHCGGNTGKGDDHAAAARFWRDMVAANKQGSKGDVTAEVNKTHYIKEVGKKTTDRAAEFEAWLKDNKKQRIEISSVLPWGCVMGIRTNGKWAFYLQENASIVYTTMVKKHIFSSAKLETRIVS